MRHLTPRQIVEELDKYIVGQHDAKRAVTGPAEKQVEERLLDYLLPRGAEPERFGLAAAAEEDARNRRERTRDKLREQLRDGQLDESMVEVSVEEKTSAVGVLGQAGMEMDVELQSMFEKM